MTVHELSQEQLTELKQAYLCDTEDAVWYSQLAEIDEWVSDEAVFREYEGTSFSDDDFLCTCGR